MDRDWNNKKVESIAERLQTLKARRSSRAEDKTEEWISDCKVLLYTYCLDEESEDARVRSLNCLAYAEDSKVQLSVYFDDEGQAAAALEMARNLRYTS